jgi:aryl-alcohol dehydrogenase-like predicted oxidoreductase
MGSNFASWHIATAQGFAAARHFMGLVSEQSLYNLSACTIDLEVIPALRLGLGLIPYSPLGGGLLGVRCRRPVRAAEPMTGCSSGSSSSDRSWRPTRSCVASSVRCPLMSRWLGC